MEISDILYAVIQVIGGLLTAVTVCIILAMIILPIYAAFGIFVNKPEGLERSGVHFFTRLSPGQVKIIDQDGRLSRMIMDIGGKKFARTGRPDQEGYWEIVDNNGDPEDPTAGTWKPIRWWAKLVYSVTGAVFIGIYPLVRVREKELERTKINRTEEITSGSNLVLTVKEDLSDHLRGRKFLFPMHFVAAETSDKIGLDIIGIAKMEVYNPHQAAYKTDRWEQEVIALVTDAATSKTKGMMLDQALTAKSDAEARIIQEAICAIGRNTGCGIQILGFDILEINPILTEEGLKDIQAEALAIQRGKATEIDGKARAKALTAINEANQSGGQHSIATMQAEALVRAAKAAGENGGSVILTPGGGQSSGTDPIQAAILAELKKLNGRNQR